MSPGNVELAQVVAMMIVSPVAVAAIVRIDERRLNADQLARAWPPASRGATVFGAWQFVPIYGCVGLIVHFTKTRWSLGGLGLGVLWAVVLYALNVGAFVLTDVVIDWLGL